MSNLTISEEIAILDTENEIEPIDRAARFLKNTTVNERYENLTQPDLFERGPA